MGESRKRVHTLLLVLLLLLGCLAIQGQCSRSSVDDKPDVWCYKGSSIPSCNPKKNNCYCCTGNWTCYKTMEECNSKCSLSATVSSSSSSPPVLP